ncbi:winged helix-turn-helix transcriptional regulator [Streptomyces sp. 142MFCol3.1]|uniref:winged helix-turn-helix transcriptional regulator n=1 Tax=Streptomyces sp. 142MFCol3.1 TaxID=1172179 RepID=UPI00041F1188|nr:helix-turn-helix domain-containing protein [Streptomyces sp. 142MFCol3.1]
MALTLDGRLTPLDWSPENCSIRRTLDLLGPASSILILREALYGTRRFDRFVERLGMSETSVAARLKQLTQAGVLERKQYREPGSRPREEYVLTQRGEDLLPVLMALMQWGNHYLQDDPAPLHLVDGAGRPVHLVFQREDGATVAAEDLHLRSAQDL